MARNAARMVGCRCVARNVYHDSISENEKKPDFSRMRYQRALQPAATGIARALGADKVGGRSSRCWRARSRGLALSTRSRPKLMERLHLHPLDILHGGDKLSLYLRRLPDRP